MNTGREIIEGGGWATCRLCFDAFRRETRTFRYCIKCGNGFCEGQHGNFAYGHGKCVICGVHRNYNDPWEPPTVTGGSK